jgi:hypothetical protein
MRRESDWHAHAGYVRAEVILKHSTIFLSAERMTYGPVQHVPPSLGLTCSTCASATTTVTPTPAPPTTKPDPLAAKMNRIDRLVRTGKAQGEALLNKKAALLMHSSSQGKADQHA